MSHWRETSKRVIRRAIEQAKAEGLTPEEALKRIDAAYPFGQRANHPYSIWLQVRREARIELGLLVKPETPFAPGPLFGGKE